MPQKIDLPVPGWTQSLASLSIMLWVGSLLSIGYLTVPVLFSTLDDKMLAGLVAGRMFNLVFYVGVVCAGILLLCQFIVHNRLALRLVGFWIIIAMVLLAMIGEWGIQPIMAELKAQAMPNDVMHSAFAGHFRTLHGIAEILYLVQCLLGVTLTLQPRLLNLR